MQNNFDRELTPHVLKELAAVAKIKELAPAIRQYRLSANRGIKLATTATKVNDIRIATVTDATEVLYSFMLKFGIIDSSIGLAGFSLHKMEKFLRKLKLPETAHVVSYNLSRDNDHIIYTGLCCYTTDTNAQGLLLHIPIRFVGLDMSAVIRQLY